MHQIPTCDLSGPHNSTFSKVLITSPIHMFWLPWSVQVKEKQLPLVLRIPAFAHSVHPVLSSPCKHAEVRPVSPESPPKTTHVQNMGHAFFHLVSLCCMCTHYFHARIAFLCLCFFVLAWPRLSTWTTGTLPEMEAPTSTHTPSSPTHPHMRNTKHTYANANANPHRQAISFNEGNKTYTHQDRYETYINLHDNPLFSLHKTRKYWPRWWSIAVVTWITHKQCQSRKDKKCHYIQGCYTGETLNSNRMWEYCEFVSLWQEQIPDHKDNPLCPQYCHKIHQQVFESPPEHSPPIAMCLKASAPTRHLHSPSHWHDYTRRTRAPWHLSQSNRKYIRSLPSTSQFRKYRASAPPSTQLQCHWSARDKHRDTQRVQDLPQQYIDKIRRPTAHAQIDFHWSFILRICWL